MNVCFLFPSSIMIWMITIIIVIITPSSLEAKCVMNGSCGTVETMGGDISAPCSLVHDPVAIVWPSSLDEDSEIDPELESKFSKLCPMLSSDGPLCCSLDQVQSMVDNMMAVPRQILGSCPSCFANFAALFCAMTCSPKQSDFVQIKTTINPADPPFVGAQQVDSITYSIQTDWPDKLFTSCKDISVSGVGPALTVMGCDEGCDGHKLVQSLGSRDKSPFLIDYDFGSSSTAMNEQTFPCESSPVGSFDSFPCSCSDCAASCSTPTGDDDCTNSSSIIDDTSVIRLEWAGSLKTRLVIMAVASTILSVFFLILCIYSFQKLEGRGRNESVSWFTSFRRQDDEDEERNPIIEEEKKKKLSFVERSLDSWTRICCRHPLIVIAIALVAITVSSFGLRSIEMVNDPVSLWSSPSSTARIQKNFFDHNFGPFFRVQQVIISSIEKDHFEATFPSDDKVVNVSNLFKADLLKEVLKLESELSSLIVSNQEEDLNGTSLDQICFSPLKSIKGVKKCVIQSPSNYFQSNQSVLELDQKKYLDHIRSCIINPVLPSDGKYFNVPCLGPFGGPGFPNVVFGGFNDRECRPKNGSTVLEPEEWVRVMSNSSSLVLTILIQNHPVGSLNRKKAEEWESLFLSHMKSFIDKNRVEGDNVVTMAGQSVTVSYFSERSVEDEIERQSRSDVSTIALSYLVMFAYVSLSLGQFINSSRLFVDSKMALGLAGVLIVLASVSSSIGLTSYAGSKGTLIIVEVLPFLVLAVGVDNIFILVQSFQRNGFNSNRSKTSSQSQSGRSFGSIRRRREEEEEGEGEEESLEDAVARTVSSVGPSILLSAAAESACFLIGSFLSSMPAVNAFALNAALSLFISLLLQFSLFLSLFFLDTKRQIEGRIDLFFCFRSSRSSESINHGGDDVQERSGQSQEERQGRESIKQESIKLLAEAGSKSRIQAIFSRYFVPLVATRSRSPRILFTIFLIFSTFLTLAIIPDLKVGLEQEISMPQDSYVLKYFKDQKSQLKVGAPLYFVLESATQSQEPIDGRNVSIDVLLDFNRESDQNEVCGGGSCSNTSLVSLLKAKSRESRSKVTGPVNSWLDDYLSWVASPACCRSFNNDSNLFCPSSLSIDSGLNRNEKCKPCDSVSKPRPPDFYKYLDWFLADDPTRDCAVGGHAQYSTALSFLSSSSSSGSIVSTDSGSKNNPRSLVGSSWFMAYHKPAPTSDHFVASILEGRKLAAEVEANFRQFNISAKVFPYSVFYVYYEQYLSIWKDTLIALSASMATILVVVLVSRLLGHIINSFIFLITLMSFLIHLMGFMFWSNISLNALSLVNLVMASGISVEFCSHVAVSFLEQSTSGSFDDSENGMDDRTRAVFRSLKSTGSSVLSGITLTKLGGVIVLAFAKSQIFSIYYFRLYLGILILGAYHGLVVLPVLLSLFGRIKNRRGFKSSTTVEAEGRNSSQQQAESVTIISATIDTKVREEEEEKEDVAEVGEKEEGEKRRKKETPLHRSFSIESD